jgi:acyl-coenzyme A thioesterase PaaI-like protein
MVIFERNDMELNDRTDYQRCFVCGMRNPYGLHLVFRLEDKSVLSDFMPREEHQGFPGVIHGGIVASVLDEVLNRTSMLAPHPAWTMTGRLEVRYRRYVPYGKMLRARATTGQQRGRMIQASGILTLADDESVVLAEAQGTFMALTPDLTQEIMKDYPGMRTLFESEQQSERQQQEL